MSAAEIRDLLLCINTYPPAVPVRQWVLSFPIPLRSLFAVHPDLLLPILQIIHRAIATFLIDQTGIKRDQAALGRERPLYGKLVGEFELLHLAESRQHQSTHSRALLNHHPMQIKQIIWPMQHRHILA